MELIVRYFNDSLNPAYHPREQHDYLLYRQCIFLRSYHVLDCCIHPLRCQQEINFPQKWELAIPYPFQ